jgi:hypothetical protein
MKRRISLLLTMVMALTMSFPSFAAADTSDTHNSLSGSSQASITAEYVDGGTATVNKYSVTIAWKQSGILKYTSDKTTYTWNSDSLSYEPGVADSDKAAWTIEDAKIAFTVKNRSDLPVNATCGAVSPATGLEITGNYGSDKDTTKTLSLESAAVDLKQSRGEQSAEATYTISSVSGAITASSSIGSITVSLSAGDN